MFEIGLNRRESGGLLRVTPPFIHTLVEGIGFVSREKESPPLSFNRRKKNRDLGSD